MADLQPGFWARLRRRRAEPVPPLPSVTLVAPCCGSTMSLHPNPWVKEFMLGCPCGRFHTTDNPSPVLVEAGMQVIDHMESENG